MALLLALAPRHQCQCQCQHQCHGITTSTGITASIWPRSIMAWIHITVRISVMAAVLTSASLPASMSWHQHHGVSIIKLMVASASW